VFHLPCSGIGPIQQLHTSAYSRIHDLPTGWPAEKGSVNTHCRRLPDPENPIMTIRIMLVDDNRTFLAAVRNFLVMLPDVAVVGEAHDGSSALRLAQEVAPDLVLLDIAMPEMNGLEVAESLSQFEEPPNFIFLSMHDSQSYRAAARDLGAYGYVSKGDFVVDLVPLIDVLVAAEKRPLKSPTGVQGGGQ
jgi:CheY-like chemotaxis protein